MNKTGLGLYRTVMEMMLEFQYLYWLIHVNVPFVGEPWMSME